MLATIFLLFQHLAAYTQLAGENSYLTSLQSKNNRGSEQIYSVVDEVHGTLNLTIPLHVIEYGGISIPITLSYIAEGIRSGQLSSEVGLGWSINSVGSISRSVLGFPDEGKVGKLDYNYSFAPKNSYNPFVAIQLNPCTPYSGAVPIVDNPNDEHVLHSFRRGWLRHGIKPDDTGNWLPSDILTQDQYYPDPQSEWFDCGANEVETFNFFVNSGYFDLQPDLFNLNGPFASGNFFLLKNSNSAATNMENLNCAFVPYNNSPELNVKFEYEDLTSLNSTYNYNFGVLKPFVMHTSDGIYVSVRRTHTLLSQSKFLPMVG